MLLHIDPSTCIPESLPDDFSIRIRPHEFTVRAWKDVADRIKRRGYRLSVVSSIHDLDCTQVLHFSLSPGELKSTPPGFKGTINNWSVVVYPVDPYHAPELATNQLRLAGRLSTPGNESEIDILTSRPEYKRGTDYIVTKSGSVYALGSVDPVYERLNPKARERLFASLPESL